MDNYLIHGNEQESSKEFMEEMKSDLNELYKWMLDCKCVRNRLYGSARNYINELVKADTHFHSWQGAPIDTVPYMEVQLDYFIFEMMKNEQIIARNAILKIEKRIEEKLN